MWRTVIYRKCVPLLCALTLVLLCAQFPSDGPVAPYAVHTVVEHVPNVNESVRVLCLVSSSRGLTSTSNIRETWGQQCNLLTFVTNDDVTAEVNVPGESLDYLWHNYRDEIDWLIVVDDKTYVVMSNLRKVVSSMNASDALWFNWVTNGVSSAGCFSKGALSKLIDANKRTSDFMMGHLATLGAERIDGRNSSGMERFVAFSLEDLHSTGDASFFQREASNALLLAGVKANQMQLIHFLFNSISQKVSVARGVPELEKRIFFLETSGRPSLKLRAACAVESAAKANPNRPIQVLIFNATVDESSPSMQVLSHYPNVQVYGLTFEEYFNKTPFETWFQEGKWRQSPYLVAHLSDYLRILSLWKGGGIYMDTDFVVLRSLDDLDNFSCTETPSATSNGVIGLDLKHPLLEILTLDMSRTYNPNSWSGNGPGALERALKVYCNESKVESMTAEKCNGYTLLPARYFYPIHYSSWRQYFDENQELSKFNESYALHVWNKLSFNETVRVGSRQLYALAAAKHCPHVFAAAATVF